MNTKLYRLHQEAGLSLASTAASVASEVSELSNEQTFCHTSLGVRETGKATQKGHTMNAVFNTITRTIGGWIIRTPKADRDYLDEKVGQVALAFVGVLAEIGGAFYYLLG